MRTPLFLFVCSIATAATLRAEPIHVLVWDERQPRQAEAYDNFLGNEIAVRLKASAKDFELRSVALDDPQQGLSAGNIEWADVIVWWGHVRQNQVKAANAKRVVEYIRRGDLDLIALHSAHWARPFVEAMNWRSIEDGRKTLRKTCSREKTHIRIGCTAERIHRAHSRQRADARLLWLQEGAKRVSRLDSFAMVLLSRLSARWQAQQDHGEVTEAPDRQRIARDVPG